MRHRRRWTHRRCRHSPRRGRSPRRRWTSGIINGTKPKMREAMDPRALWLWGRLRDFERMGRLDVTPGDLIDEMTDAMQADECRDWADKMAAGRFLRPHGSRRRARDACQAPAGLGRAPHGGVAPGNVS
jgi:hypothetical protein